MKLQMESVPCPNGCYFEDVELFTARDRLHNLPGEFSIVRCNKCGLIRTNPRPTPESIGNYYPDNYGPYLGTRIVNTPKKNTSLLKKCLRPVFRHIIRFYTDFIPEISSGRMLEVGCASGVFLAQMSDRGWQVEGLEFSETAANHARSAGFNVHVGSLETAPEPVAPYDLIVGWMVVEHLHDPVSALTKLARWTKPGGWLVLSLPNVSSFEFTIFRGASYALQVPTHLYHYSPDTLSILLTKTGWQVKSVFHQRVLSNLFGSIGLKLEDWGAPSWLILPFKKYPTQGGCWGLILYPLALLLAALGQTGRMTVWAQRVDGNDR